MVDLVGHYRRAGGYGNVATILKEIGQLNGSALARIASPRGRTLVRRTGWLLDRYGQVDNLGALRQAERFDLGEAGAAGPTGTGGCASTPRSSPTCDPGGLRHYMQQSAFTYPQPSCFT